MSSAVGMAPMTPSLSLTSISTSSSGMSMMVVNSTDGCVVISWLISESGAVDSWLMPVSVVVKSWIMLAFGVVKSVSGVVRFCIMSVSAFFETATVVPFRRICFTRFFTFFLR